MAGFTQTKASKILSERNPTLHGKRPTPAQFRLLGFIKGGGKPNRLKGKRNINAIAKRK